MNPQLILAKPDLDHARSNSMLEFVIRNQIGTNDALHKIVVPEVAPATAQKLIQRLIKRDLLKRWPLSGCKSYLRLGPSAIARWQYPQSLSRRLGPQVLPYLLGSLSLMTYHKPPLKRLLPHQIIRQFPGFPATRDLHQWAYYRDRSSGVSRLVTVRVEFRVGGETVVQKIADQLHRYRQHSAVDRLIDDQRFLVHVVTATPEQEAALWSASERLLLPVELRTCHDTSLTCFL